MTSAEGSDLNIANVAAGFTLGFGFLTVWNAIKQTAAIRSPLRSTYVYLVWGEIAANVTLGIVGYSFINGLLPSSLPVLLTILTLWVFELHLLMQIIINRIAVVADNPRLITQLKWGTAALVLCVNISVYCIWIPAHLDPPPFPLLVEINKYWDRVEKVIIFIIDGSLNYYFMTIVNKRLLNYHGLKKYKPLVSFNARIMILSIGLDVMLICLMQLKNAQIYVQFHPLIYMVKLNIELSMATLIKKLAQSSTGDNRNEFIGNSSSNQRPHPTAKNGDTPISNGISSSIVGGKAQEDERNYNREDDFQGIMTMKEVNVEVHSIQEAGQKDISKTSTKFDNRKIKSQSPTRSDDKLPLVY